MPIRFRTPLVIVFLALVIAQLGPLILTLRLFETINKHHVDCQLIGKNRLSMSEDLTVYKWGKVFVSSGNLQPVIGLHAHIPEGNIFKSSPKIEQGKIGLINVQQNENEKSCVQLLPIDNFPSSLAFHPHGLFFSNTTKRLYAVNHALNNGGSGVVVFNIKDDQDDKKNILAKIKRFENNKKENHNNLEDEDDDDDDECQIETNVRLEFVRYITSPLFQNAGPNDVIEGLISNNETNHQTLNEIYVTKMFHFPINMNGRDHPNNRKEVFQSLAQELIMLDIPQNFVWLSSRIYKLFGLEYSNASVIRCSWHGGQGKYKMEKKKMKNRRSRRTDTKNDTDDDDDDDDDDDENKEEEGDDNDDDTMCEVVVKDLVGANGITISPNRKQIFVNDFPKQKVIIYNRQSTGELKQHSHVNLPYLADNIEYDISTGDIYVGSIPQPLSSIRAMYGDAVFAGGGLVVLHKTIDSDDSNDESGKWEDQPQLQVFHDGSSLSVISSALKHGNKVLMGSPYSPGVLQCSIPQ